MKNIEQINNSLKNMLDEKRYCHSVGVANEAVRIAELVGYDTDRAYLAGLIHDCAKRIPYDESVRIAQDNGEVLDSVTLACPGIVHAPVGAVIARREFGITDNEILNAVRYHTVAREKMTLLEKIIYIADMTEPNRNFDGVEELRQACCCDIDAAFFKTLRQSVIFNMEKGNILHPNTIYAWNELCMKNKIQ